MEDQEILDHFVKAELPGRVYQDLYAFLEVAKDNPIAVRSSSKLEDSHYQPFAGIYSTYMIPRDRDKKSMVNHISEAIKEVYASVYYKSSKAYMNATANVIDEEKMGIILQEVCGSKHGEVFYPTISGVARSINFYPIAPEKPNEGIASIAFGLGKYIVDGGVSLRFSPKYPKKILQLSSNHITAQQLLIQTMADSGANSFALDTALQQRSQNPNLTDHIKGNMAANLINWQEPAKAKVILEPLIKHQKTARFKLDYLVALMDNHRPKDAIDFYQKLVHQNINL